MRSCARRRLALLACAAWLVAFEFAPLLHVALHDHFGHHHHDASGAVVEDHDDDAAADADDGNREEPTHLERALAHGRHNLAHHGVAVQPPAPVVTHPLPVDRRAVFVAAIEAIAPCSIAPPIATARGPPLPPA